MKKYFVATTNFLEHGQLVTNVSWWTSAYGTPVPEKMIIDFVKGKFPGACEIKIESMVEATEQEYLRFKHPSQFSLN